MNDDDDIIVIPLPLFVALTKHEICSYVIIKRSGDFGINRSDFNQKLRKIGFKSGDVGLHRLPSKLAKFGVVLTRSKTFPRRYFIKRNLA